MKTIVVLAPGPSLDIATAEYVRGKCPAVAVSNAYQLAPWADVLVAHDVKWWNCYADAKNFANRKICRFTVPGLEKYAPAYLPGSCNSGLMGMYFAQHEMGAERLILCGFDMHGTHFFGRHPDGADIPEEIRLRNTSDARRQTFLKQFRRWEGCDVVNCTAGSAIDHFRFMDLREAL